MKWKLTSKPKEWKKHYDNKYKFQLEKVSSDSELIVTYINHSSFLLQLNGFNILTDPVFADVVGPLNLIGPSRVREPGILMKELPKIDIVVISHNHYDHLDIKSLEKINELHSPLFLIPFGDSELFLDNGINNIIEMKWWESAVINNDFKITFTPAKHASNRGIFDRNKSLWGSYLFNFKGKNIYFGGDTGYDNHFKRIGDFAGHIEFSLLPIGAYEPRSIMRVVHTNPEEAVQAHLDLRSKLSIGMHFGTFQLTDEGIDDPVKDLIIAKKKHHISEQDFQILEIGKSYKFYLNK